MHCHGFLFTIGLPQEIGFGLAVNPSLNSDKVRHEAGNVALEDDVIAENHILPEGVRLIILADRWKGGKFDISVKNIHFGLLNTGYLYRLT